MPAIAALAAFLGAAPPSGWWVPDAAAQGASRSSFRSPAGDGSGVRGGGSPQRTPAPARPLVPSAPPGPSAPPEAPSTSQARVWFVAYPGGHIYVDDKLAGIDETKTMTLSPGKHNVRVENRFLGSQTLVVDLPAGRSGVVILEW